MNMRDRLLELIKDLDPEIKTIVAEVVALERENIDFDRPRVKDDIREIVDKYARHGLGTNEA